jgi:hypothetical protein
VRTDIADRGAGAFLGAFRPLSAVFALVAVLASAGSAHAADAIPVDLVYRAAPGCPDASAFVARLRARSARIRPKQDGERAYTAAVTLSSGSSEATGEVELRDVDGRVARRHVDGEDCSDVADALALVIALDAVGSAAVPPRPPPPLPWAPPLAPLPSREPPPASSRVGSWSPLVFAAAGFASGIAPSLAPSGTLAFGADRRGGWVDGALVLGVSYTSVHASGAGDTVAFRLVNARLDGCAWRAPLGRRITLMPCARLDVGYHFAEVVPNGLGAAGAALVRLGLAAWLRVDLIGPFFATVTAAGEASVTPADYREQYAATTLYTSPPVTGTVDFGAGVSFP